jgi:hypothetical protein
VFRGQTFCILITWCSPPPVAHLFHNLSWPLKIDPQTGYRLIKLAGFRLSRVAQSVQCLTTGWTTGRTRIDLRQRRKDFSSSLCVQTSSDAHPSPIQWIPGVLSPGVKRSWHVTLTAHPHLVPTSRMNRRYTSSTPKIHHGVYWDSFRFRIWYLLDPRVITPD